MVYFQFGAIINELYVKTIVQVFCECMVSFFLAAFKECSCQVILSCMKKLYEDFFIMVISLYVLTETKHFFLFWFFVYVIIIFHYPKAVKIISPYYNFLEISWF